MGDEQIDFAAEGLLDGLEGQQRSERLTLLRQLADDGVPLAELRRNTAAGSIMYLPADRVIVGRERYTASEVRTDQRRRTGLPRGCAPRDGPADTRAGRGRLHGGGARALRG